MINFRKTIAATLAAATLGLGVAAATPAAAGGFHHHHGWGWGGAALAGGLALGAVAAAAAPVYYGGCYMTRQPVTDYYGNVVGYRRIRVCD
jgi:hypothetical protein